MANKKGMRCDQPTADIIGVPLHVWLILVQGLVWVLLPLIFEGSIRLDVAEGVIGGPEWQLSYFRHPPLSTWLTGLASMTGSARLPLSAAAISSSTACSMTGHRITAPEPARMLSAAWLAVRDTRAGTRWRLALFVVQLASVSCPPPSGAHQEK